MIDADLIVENAGALATCTGMQKDGREAAVALRQGWALAARDGAIVWTGPQERRKQEVRPLPGAERIDAEGGVVGPGFVDAHTHLVFAGDRAAEFSARCAGASYQELLAQGGGILATVRATREASEAELFDLALPRVWRLVREGVTTVEIKSGYGLSVADELKMLRVIRRLGEDGPIPVVATALPLHALPPEAAGRREAWIDEMLEELLPTVQEEGLARFVDIFVEEGAFTADEARRLAEAAKALGLEIRLHVDQLSVGAGAELAAELGAATADHLETTTPEGIAALADAGVSATLLPTSTLYLKCPAYAQGRALWDAGVPLALGSNCNPGSAMSESYSLSLSLACLGNGLHADEAFYAATAGGARALRLSDRGKLEVGARADLVVFAAESIDHLAYHMGVSHARVVVSGGKVIHRAEAMEPICR